MLLHLSTDHFGDVARWCSTTQTAKLPATPVFSFPRSQLGAVQPYRNHDRQGSADLFLRFASPCQSGSHEYTNGLLCRDRKKGTDLPVHDPERLDDVVALSNTRTSLTPEWDSPLGEYEERLLVATMT